MREVRHPSAAGVREVPSPTGSSPNATRRIEALRRSLRKTRLAVGALALAALVVVSAGVPNALAAPTFTLEDSDLAYPFPPSDTLIALGFPLVGGGGPARSGPRVSGRPADPAPGSTRGNHPLRGARPAPPATGSPGLRRYRRALLRHGPDHAGRRRCRPRGLQCRSLVLGRVPLSGRVRRDPWGPGAAHGVWIGRVWRPSLQPVAGGPVSGPRGCPLRRSQRTAGLRGADRR